MEYAKARRAKKEFFRKLKRLKSVEWFLIRTISAAAEKAYAGKKANVASNIIKLKAAFSVPI